MDGEKKKVRVTSHSGTLLDGEIVTDCKSTEERDEKVLTFLVYDIILLNKKNVTSLSLPDRLKLVKTQVIMPRITVLLSLVSLSIYIY